MTPPPRAVYLQRMSKRRVSEPPAVPDPGSWCEVIEAIPTNVFGRYRIYLTHGMMIYGPDAWGWTRWTMKSAYRKGKRERRRMQEKETRLAMRQAKLETLVRRG